MGVAVTSTQPLNVAVVGSGPAGFFAIEHLFSRPDLEVRVDLFERLPMPFGLVRFGVAPDHQKIKSVVRKFDKLATDPRFRFFGNVEFGRVLSIDDMRRYYHAICFATGAPSSRRLGIPGEDLAGCHSATDFVAWYNGHPDHRELRFDLSATKVAVVGNGNVAIDVARMLCRTSEELSRTDIADHALDEFRRGRVREVVLLGRRGPAQAAFTIREIKELAGLENVDFVVRPAELDLDDVSREMLRGAGSRRIVQKLEVLQAAAERSEQGKPRRLTVRFRVSPVELLDDGTGRVRGLRLVHNRLEERNGRIRAISMGTSETLEAGLVLSAVGYRGVALPGVPFNRASGTLPHEGGRVLAAPGGRPLPGLYVTGWFKRGPSGVIGTNKPDSAETVQNLLEDFAGGRLPVPAGGDEDAMPRLLAERGVRVITYDDWTRIDTLEVTRGARSGRPRVKLTSLDECLAAADERKKLPTGSNV